MAARAVQLANIAAKAEALRLRRFARRQAVRAAFGVVAVVFLIAAVVGAHVAGAMALTLVVAPIWAALIVAGIDLLFAIVFVLLAMRNTPDRVEREALLVRLRAQEQMKEAIAFTTMIGPLLRLLGTRKVYGLALATLTARFLGGNR